MLPRSSPRLAPRSARSGSASIRALGVIGVVLALGAFVVWALTRGPAPEPTPTVVEPTPAKTTTNGGERSPGDVTLQSPDDPAPPIDEGPAPELGDHAGFFGHLRVRPDRPLARVEIRFELERDDGTREAFGSARTSSDGAYAFPLPRDARGAWIVATASARGTLDLRERRRWPEQASSTPLKQRWDLFVMPGATITGRALDAHGAPVGGAHVELLVPSRRGDTPIESVAASADTSSDGRFEIGFTSAATYALRVRAPNVGCAAKDALELEADTPRDLGDLVLRGDGTLGGVAVHPDGSPAPHLELWAVPAELAARGDAHALAVAKAERAERDDGLAWTRTFSDTQGRFTLRGLKPGSYGVLSPRTDMRLVDAARTFATSDETLRIVVSSARLSVRVVDASGNAVTKARVACGRMVPDSDSPGSFQIAGERWEALRPGAARIEFALEPDRAYALRAVLGDRSVEDVVQLAPGELEVERTLVLPDEGALGSLRVLASCGASSVHAFRVSFVSAVTGERLAELADLAPDAAGVVGPVPPGRYELEIVPRDPSLALALPARPRDPVSIRAGATEQLEVAFPVGAALELALSIDGPPPAGFEYTPRAGDGRATRESGKQDHERERGATLRLTPVGADASAARVLGFDEPTEIEGVPPLVESTLLPGRRAAVHGVIVPGAYVARVEAPGFEPVETTVTLAAGERRTLEFALRAR